MVMSYHTTAYQARRKTSGLIVKATLSEQKHNGRTYKLLSVQTQEGLDYLCLRLYDNTGRFIKQFLVEPELVAWLRSALPFPEGARPE